MCYDVCFWLRTRWHIIRVRRSCFFSLHFLTQFRRPFSTFVPCLIAVSTLGTSAKMEKRRKNMAKVTWFSPTVRNNSAPKKIYHHHHLDVGQTCRFTIICHEVTIGTSHPWKPHSLYSRCSALSRSLAVSISLRQHIDAKTFYGFHFSAANRTSLSFGFSINDFIDKNAIWRHVLSGVFLFESEKQSMIRC